MASPGFSPPVLATVASGGPATAAQANLWTEYLQWMASTNKTDSRPYAVLNASAAVALTATVQTAISFDTEVADVGNGHVNPSTTYTIPTTGLWLITGIATYATSTSANTMISKIVVNGSTIIAADVRIGNANVAIVDLGPAYAGLTAGDTVQLTQQTSNGINTDITYVRPTLVLYWLNA